MAADRVVEPSMYRPMAAAASARVSKAVRQTSSDFSVLKNVSTMALSKQFPRPDMEIRMPLAFSSAW